MKILFDENFNNDFIKGIFKRNPDIDAVRVQDIGLSQTDDRIILEWAAKHERVLFTNDVQTMIEFAYDRIEVGQPMPGLFEVKRHLPHALVIEEIILLAECSLPGEWEHKIMYLPLK